MKNLLGQLFCQDRSECREHESADAEDVADQIVGKLKNKTIKIETNN